MKLFFTSLFACVLITTSGQQVEILGRYSNSFGFGWESIEFVGKDSFYFSGSYCTYWIHGKGRCEIKNNKLYLYFEKANDTTTPVRPPEITTLEKADSLAIVTVICLDEEGKPIPFAAEVKLNRFSKMGTITNEDGIANLKIPKSSLPITIKTITNGYEKETVSITPDSNYKIRIFHRIQPSGRELNKGEVYIYELDDVTEDVISMRPERSEGRYEQYRKKNPKE